MGLIILTLLLGPLGAYRFYKGEYKLGILYLCTGGLIGIGYAYDLYLSIKEYLTNKSDGSSVENAVEFKKNIQTKAIAVTVAIFCVIGFACITLSETSPTYDDESYSSTTDSWNDSYSNCVRCGKKTQRKYLYSNLCGKCYHATH